jgi:ubiquinone/menaquinone biosynthesis C-methylase UbiE
MTSEAGTPERSVAFDRAAEYYDATRAATPVAMAKIVAILSAELGRRGRCLEIGVGTGRIGLPLYRAGVEMTGLDLSMPMMRKLVTKAEDDRFPLVQGDATRLPFRDDVFGAALIVHVLHLIPNWRDALRELVRVVRSGGAIVSSIGEDKEEEPSMWEEMQNKFRELSGAPPRFPGFRRTEEIDEAMAAVGATRRELESVPEIQPHNARQIADLMESGVFSFTWDLDPAARTSAAEELRRWAKDRYGSLEAIQEDRFEIPWRAYDLPD